MKKLFLVLVTSLAISLVPAAADTAMPQFNAHVDVLPILFNVWSGGGEVAIPVAKMSVAANLEYSPNFFWTTGISLFDIQAKARYYIGDLLTFPMPDFLSFLKKGPLSGAFVGAGASYDSLSESWGGVTWTASSFGILAEVGSKYFFNEHFFAEGTVGLDLQSPVTWSVSSGSTSQTFAGQAYTPSAFSTSVSFGYAF